MNWEVFLAGSRLDLEDLALSFTGSDWTITKSNDRYVLTSPEFEALNDSEKIRSLAELFLERINGAAKLVLDSGTAVRIEAIHGPHPDGSGGRANYMGPIHFGAGAVMRASMSFVQPDGTIVTHHPADEIRSWIRLAKTDDSVAKVLDLLSDKWDWVNLYRIFEIVMDDSGGLDKIQ
ncbi:hypothetical protein AYO44_07565 [Planctomycetaceae bacterium SCGC AG-212-F19]|nr:hypothetical protein AYO44_07565 [Planctomycetaceae bacterium SCGC AG-212-F19]